MVMMTIGPAARVAIAACGLGLVLQPASARAQDSNARPDALQQLNGPNGIERAGQFIFLPFELD